MQELAGIDAAAAVFPLQHPEKPHVGHLWVFRDSNSRITRDHRSEGFFGKEGSTLLESFPGIKVFVLQTGNGPFIGRSWQLAFHLAVRALDDRDLKKKLVSGWMVTGEVEKDRIHRVGIGNKTEIATKRNWLFSRDNDGSWPQNWIPLGQVRIAETIDEAIDVILDRGTIREGPVSWPDCVETVYSFSSEAETPIAAFGILSGARKVVLFCSKDQRRSVKPAMNIKRFLEDNTSMIVEIPEERISSTDVYLAEKFLIEKMKLHNGEREKHMLFNITNGNKIMHIALANIANRYPGITQVYREIDSGDLYTAIYKEGRLPITRTFENGATSSLTLVPEKDKYAYLRRMLEKKTMRDFLAVVRVPVLVGNSFPMAKIKSRVVIEQKSFGELKSQIDARGYVSYWGHKNTLHLIEKHIGYFLEPDEERPSLDINEVSKKPMLNGIEFSECWVVAPEYKDGIRPDPSKEVSLDEIENWVVNRIAW